ncbi:hypothetical protein BJ322DRAFT_518413 [Thelephora terrestris]|uniref:Uncharacterized protein n=1 Tax=Thelephora terrestris TaxID=56493 RepID=A0A9P6H298_9AGAM|nr:hypothetical protein BJ322DRAFT_518413 [Thelephora terrestris]
MIVKKEEVAQDESQLLDAPPSYDQIVPRQSASSDFRPDVKADPASSSSTPTPTSISGPPLQQAKPKPRTTWLDSFRLSQQAKEVRSTVRSIIRDVVKEPKTPASMGLLESCADACSSNNLSFSEILQDPSIEGHPAIYWAIVKRPSPDDFELITALMSYSAPLTVETMTEVRLACLHVGDQALFQCLWRSPEYGALTGSDRMLLGVTSPPDTMDVEELPGPDGPFRVRFNIVQFEKRMKVSADIGFEFIARGRIWKLRFYVTRNEGTHQPGPWAVTLQILEQSPPTPLEARILIKEPEKEQASPSSPPVAAPPPNGLLAQLLAPCSSSSPKQNPPIEFRLKLKAGVSELIPTRTGRKPEWNQKVQTLFTDNAQGNSLQYPDSPYYYPDGSLRVTLEGRLAARKRWEVFQPFS